MDFKWGKAARQAGRVGALGLLIVVAGGIYKSAEAHGPGGGVVYVHGMPPVSPHSPLYVVDVQKGVTPAQVKLGIEMGAEAENMNLVGTLNVQNGLKARGIKSNKPYVIYEVCNLVLGAKVLKTMPEFGAFAPCKVVLFEQGGRLKLVTYLPTYALRYFPPSPVASRVARQLDVLIIKIMQQAAAGGL